MSCAIQIELSRSDPVQANEALHFSAVAELNQICLGRIKL